MRLPLREEEAREIEARVAQLEARTGVEVVCAVHVRADTYPEAPWRAFAIGCAVAACVLAFAELLRPQWPMPGTLLVSLAVPLLAGLACALLTLAVPGWARLFIGPLRREVEVRERARALFTEQRMARTRAHTAVLIFASLFERRVEIVADSGFDGRVSAADWQRVAGAFRSGVRRPSPGDAPSRAASVETVPPERVDRHRRSTAARFAAHACKRGMLDALDALEALLRDRGYAAPRGRSDELPDRPLQGGGR